MILTESPCIYCIILIDLGCVDAKKKRKKENHHYNPCKLQITENHPQLYYLHGIHALIEDDFMEN